MLWRNLNMKNIFTLLLATVSFSAFANDGGKLTITVPSSNNVQVYVDGRVYQDNNNNTIVLNNIQAGNHSITIYKNNRGNAVNKGRDNRRNNNRNDQRDVLYNSNVYVRQSYHVDVMINRFGKALVDERAINNSYGDDDDGWNDNDYRNGGYNNGNGGYNNDYHQAVSDNEFNQLLQRIRSQWIGKLSTAKDEVNGHYFNTSQIRQVLELFSSENDKLELAKLAYKNVVDKQSFRQLYDLFSYRSQTELDQYTKDARY
jgi:hypothetical protein